jgi:hypothetical protein
LSDASRADSWQGTVSRDYCLLRGIEWQYEIKLVWCGMKDIAGRETRHYLPCIFPGWSHVNYAGTQLAYSSKARDQTNIKLYDNKTGEWRETCALFLESTVLKARQSAGTWRFSLEHSLLRRYAITASN